MTSAGSPGRSCCSEKMITDTKNSVGRSCTSRRPIRVSIAHLSPCGRGRVGEADRVRGETPMPVIHLPPCGGGRVGEADRVRGETPCQAFARVLRQPFEPEPRRHGMLNAGRMIENLVIPELQDAETARLQPGVPLGIVGAVSVLSAVELDDELPLEADEVHDVAAELFLTAELEAAETAVAQQAPHPPLGFRRLAPHLARPVLQ